MINTKKYQVWSTYVDEEGKHNCLIGTFDSRSKAHEVAKSYDSETVVKPVTVVRVKFSREDQSYEA